MYAVPPSLSRGPGIPVFLLVAVYRFKAQRPGSAVSRGPALFEAWRILGVAEVQVREGPELGVGRWPYTGGGGPESR